MLISKPVVFVLINVLAKAISFLQTTMQKKAQICLNKRNVPMYSFLYIHGIFLKDSL